MPNQNTIPTIVISNFAEAHIDFLGRSDKPAERDDLINGEDYHGDRTILWADDPKLVIVNYPIAHADFNTKRLGYPNTRHLAQIIEQYNDRRFVVQPRLHHHASAGLV